MNSPAFALAFDKNFLKLLASVAIPVTIQMMLISSRSLADIIMTANLGEAEVAAMGVTGRIIFVVLMAIIGMINGGAVLIAQLWGAQASDKIRQATAHTLLLALPIAFICCITCFLLARPIVSSASDDLAVIEFGITYIQYSIFSLLAIVVSVTFSTALRCIGQAKIGMLFTGIGVGLNILLNYLLIFGHWGLPALGVKGAAIATLISTVIEAGVVLLFIYFKDNNLRLNHQDVMIGFKHGMLAKIFKIGVPLSLNSIIWAFGIFMYTFLVGKMGTQALAVLAIITPIESLVMAFYIGIASAAAVIAGNSLGASQFKQVWLQAQALVIWSIIAGLCMSVLIYFSRFAMVELFAAQSAATLTLATEVLLMLAIIGSFRSINITVIVGLLRAGGDQKFVLGMDIFCQWAVGILFTYIAIEYWQLSLFWVFLAINSEEIIKSFICVSRLISKKWMVNLVEDEQASA